MLIYDQFVFLHVPKTAGMFLTDAFGDELGPPDATFERHSGWNEIPDWAVGRPALMYVRNPWEWYVSWYRYLTESVFTAHPPDRVRRDHWVRILFGDDFEIAGDELRAINDFATTVRKACGGLDLEHPALLELLERRDPQARLVAAGNDFYTAELLRIAGGGFDSDLLTVGRFESLFDDLERFVERNGIALDGGALRDLVDRSCRALIERFGYRFVPPVSPMARESAQ